ncbi:unnamed protein product [Coregonus sp. 'balchen']|nr:unnamed protein product [Coregonus sp. 'balchen']
MFHTYTEPVTSYTEPVTSYTEPVTSYTEPVTSYTEPVTSYTEPVTSYTEPVTSYTEPVTSYTEPVTSYSLFLHIPLAQKGAMDTVTVPNRNTCTGEAGDHGSNLHLHRHQQRNKGLPSGSHLVQSLVSESDRHQQRNKGLPSGSHLFQSLVSESDRHLTHMAETQDIWRSPYAYVPTPSTDFLPPDKPLPTLKINSNVQRLVHMNTENRNIGSMEVSAADLHYTQLPRGRQEGLNAAETDELKAN